MRILLDTNVLAAGMAGQIRRSIRPPAQIWRRWQAKQFDLLVSAHLLIELERALTTAWFRDRTTSDQLFDMQLSLRRHAIFVDVTAEVSGIASHWQDDLILAAAVSGNADFLVTGDSEFRQVGEYGGVKLRTPVEFLSGLESTEEQD